MLIFSDLHLSTSTKDVALEVLRQIPMWCRRLGETHVAFLGDFFKVRHVIQLDLLLAAHDIMMEWHTDLIDTVDVLPGNHDQVNVAGRNALEVFEGIPGCRVHTNPTWTDDGLWVPYRHTRQEIQDALALAPATTQRYVSGEPPRVCFAHVAVKGAMMNNHIANADGVPDDLFKKAGFKRAFLGHYHKHQTVRKGVVYVGSPYQVTYGEAEQPKGFMTWDGKRAEFHEWDVGPKHYKLVIDVDHPQEIQLPAASNGDKLWVVVRGHMSGAMEGVVKRQLDEAGVDVERFDLDLQPTSNAARLQRQPGDSVDMLATRFVEAQDIDQSFKDMLLDTWHRRLA